MLWFMTGGFAADVAMGIRSIPTDGLVSHARLAVGVGQRNRLEGSVSAGWPRPPSGLGTFIVARTQAAGAENTSFTSSRTLGAVRLLGDHAFGPVGRPERVAATLHLIGGPELAMDQRQTQFAEDFGPTVSSLRFVPQLLVGAGAQVRWADLSVRLSGATTVSPRKRKPVGATIELDLRYHFGGAS